MTNFRFAALFIALVVMVASITGSLRAAPDNTLGMAILAASVNSDGTLLAGSGAASAAKLGTGQYRVDFDRDVLSCFRAATLESSAGEIRAITDTVTFNRVLVVTANSGGSISDASFNLLVYCAR